MDISFKKKEKNRANTATDISCLTANEKDIFFYLNLARINPKLFAETFLIENKDRIDCISNYKSLYNTLIKMDPIQPIYFDKKFYDYARCHASKSGIIGYVGHKRKNGSGCDPISDSWAECCYYGSNDPLVIVLDLLIDCGVSDLGHRKILLSENFRFMGVFIATHKTYGFNTVMDLKDE